MFQIGKRPNLVISVTVSPVIKMDHIEIRVSSSLSHRLLMRYMYFTWSGITSIYVYSAYSIQYT